MTRRGRAGGLEVATYAKSVAAEMQELGYVRAAAPERADLLVRFDYRVDNGRERVRTDLNGVGAFGPAWGPWGGWGGGFGRWGFGGGCACVVACEVSGVSSGTLSSTRTTADTIVGFAASRYL
jgi:hypothetical protein